MVQWLGGPLCQELKINVAQGKVILDFAIVLAKQCTDKQRQKYH